VDIEFVGTLTDGGAGSNDEGVLRDGGTLTGGGARSNNEGGRDRGAGSNGVVEG